MVINPTCQVANFVYGVSCAYDYSKIFNIFWTPVKKSHLLILNLKWLKKGCKWGWKLVIKGRKKVINLIMAQQYTPCLKPKYFIVFLVENAIKRDLICRIHRFELDMSLDTEYDWSNSASKYIILKISIFCEMLGSCPTVWRPLVRRQVKHSRHLVD